MSISRIIRIIPGSFTTGSRRIVSPIRRQPLYPGTICWKFSGAASQLTGSDDSVTIDLRGCLTGTKQVMGPSKFHYTWLRDNCRCSQCYNPGLNERFIDTLMALGRTTPTILSLSSEGDDDKVTTLKVVWEDGHESRYSMEWLSRNVYDGSIDHGTNEEAPFTWDRRQKPRGWGHEIAVSPPKIAYNDLLESDEKFLEFCGLIERHGFAFVDRTPLDLEGVKKLVNRIGCVSTSYYGDYYETSRDGR